MGLDEKRSFFAALLLPLALGCGTAKFQYQEGGNPLDAANTSLVKEGIAKEEVLELLGNPYDTFFLDPMEEDGKRGIFIREVMTYYAASDERSVPLVFWGNPKVEHAGRVQRFDILLENGIVVKSQYFEEER